MIPPSRPSKRSWICWRLLQVQGLTHERTFTQRPHDVFAKQKPASMRIHLIDGTYELFRASTSERPRR